MDRPLGLSPGIPKSFTANPNSPLPTDALIAAVPAVGDFLTKVSCDGLVSARPAICELPRHFGSTILEGPTRQTGARGQDLLKYVLDLEGWSQALQPYSHTWSGLDEGRRFKECSTAYRRDLLQRIQQVRGRISSVIPQL